MQRKQLQSRHLTTARALESAASVIDFPCEQILHTATCWVKPLVDVDERDDEWLWLTAAGEEVDVDEFEDKLILLFGLEISPPRWRCMEFV